MGIALWIDHCDPVADDGRWEGGVDLVADLQKGAALVRKEEDRIIESCALFRPAVVANDFCGRAADRIAQKRQISAQRERQSRTCQGQTNPENDCFDRAGLALFFWVVKVVFDKPSSLMEKELIGEDYPMAAFRIATIIIAFIPLYFGVTGIWFGAAQLMGGEPFSAAMDNQFRYLSGVYIGVSAMLFYSAGDVAGRALVFRLAILAIFIGGCARVVSYLSVGEPPVELFAGMILELIAPVLILWQAKIFGKAA